MKQTDTGYTICSMQFEISAKFDVIIIGSGISGLICALELAKENKSVCILTKEAVTESTSLYAQGGIAIPLGTDDSFEQHLLDTIHASSGLCRVSIAREIIFHSRQALEKLISYGIRFDEDNKKIHQSKEASHSIARVCHVGGDASGKYITRTLIDKASREPNISIFQGTVALKIIKDENNKAIGVLVEDITHRNYVLAAKDIIVASGGAGQLYKNTTNPKVCTGDGIAMAYLAGANLQDIEMIQFHPTVLLKRGEPLLITEAIRGEGAKLKNINGEYFASKYCTYTPAELAPRDILARAILQEMEKTKSDNVYLDLSNFKIEYFKNRFPTIYNSCIERKIQLFTSGIPVAPAAHYFIGGIKCDLYGSTNLPSLWVVGEAASNGFHGANRLASNSLLECIVAPHFLVEKLLSNEDSVFSKSDYVEIAIDEMIYSEAVIIKMIKNLREQNIENIGLVRTGLHLKNHLSWLDKLSKEFDVNLISLKSYIQEIKNMVLLSHLICNASLVRDHSLGVHFREDYRAFPDIFKHSILSQNKQVCWEVEKPQVKSVSFL